VVRVDAFLAVGGFERRLGVGGEEELFALDLAAAGWGLAYVERVIAHHHPSPTREVERRRRRQTRNSLWVAWLRLPVTLAVRETLRVVRPAVRTRGGRRGLLDAVAGWRWVSQERTVVPPEIAARRRRL
jgi:GT2 family glycosyltransferase